MLEFQLSLTAWTMPEPRSAVWSWEPFLTPNPTEVTHHHANVWPKCNRWHPALAPGHELKAGMWVTARDYFKEQAHGAHTLKINPCNCGLLALKAVSLQKLMSYSASIFCTSHWCGQRHSGPMQKCCVTSGYPWQPQCQAHPFGELILPHFLS